MQPPPNFKLLVVVIVVLSTAYASMEDDSRNMIAPSNFYGRNLDNDLLVKLLLLAQQRTCHSKRNSDIINSLLGLPKNMNNAGK